MAKLKKAIGYLRVSTIDQGESGAGLDLQMTRITRFAEAAGFTIVRTFREVQSAVGEESLSKRPVVGEAIKESEATGYPIIVDGLDRFHRNTKKLETLVVDKKLKVISAKSGQGACSAVILAEVTRAQAEAERISRATKDGLRRLRERGIKLGNPKNLKEAQAKGAAANRAKAHELVKQLAPVVKEIRAAGIETKEAIAAELNRLGYRTARDGRWTAITIRRLLARIDALGVKEQQHVAYKSNERWGMF